jgi:hypothetical protein
VVDIDVATNSLRGRSWVTIYSPDSRRYEVGIGASKIGKSNAAAQRAPLVSWDGIPENAFAGMYRPSGFEISKPHYAFAANASGMVDLPIPIWSTKSLAASWQSPSESLVESKLEGAGHSRLSGTIAHRLPVGIKDWLLAYGFTVYRPAVVGFNQPDPVLRPLQRWSPSGPQASQRVLSNFLTGVTSRASDSSQPDLVREEKMPYDPLSLNTDTIVRMITFHQEAGGTEYTGLENSTLRALDLSDLLDLDRAVFMGRIDMPAATVSIDGAPVEADRSATYVRIVLPVSQRGEVSKEPSEAGESQAARQ